MQMVQMKELLIVTFQYPLQIELQSGATGTTNLICWSDNLQLGLVSIAILGSWQ
jgi:hypothetical protein